MKFVIGASNLKVFAKSILALSKIGDELYIEPLQNCVKIIEILCFYKQLLRDNYGSI